MNLVTGLSAFHACLLDLRAGRIDVHAFCDAHRSAPWLGELPERYGAVLGQLLDRVESSALFDGESCSFSTTDLHDALQQWHERAAALAQR